MQFSEIAGSKPAGIECGNASAPGALKGTAVLSSNVKIGNLIVSLVLALGAAAASAALATEWPSRAVTVVVPYAAGGNTDFIARVTAERLSKAFGQSFVVENRTGASGMIAAEYVARRPADGYVVFLATITQISMAPFLAKIHYDPIKDFQPIVNVGANPFVAVVRSQQPFESLADLVSYARLNPGKLTVGHAGVGSTTHLSASLFLVRAGIKATMVPYKGGGPALTDVIAGVVDVCFSNLSEVMPHLQGERVKFLGVSSEKRIKQLPNVPAIAESYPGYSLETWDGLLAPAGVPAEVADKLASEVTKILASAEFRAKLEESGVTPLLGEVKEVFAQRIQQDMIYWKPVIEQLGIKPE
jgi:tripartite-type tricarboxylate transporter receptor subunit TctC